MVGETVRPAEGVIKRWNVCSRSRRGQRVTCCSGGVRRVSSRWLTRQRRAAHMDFSYPFEALRLGGFVSPDFPQKEQRRKSRQASKPPRRRDLPRGSERRTERPPFFASSREPPRPQSQEVGRKNHRKSQKDTFPIRRNRRTDTSPADDEPTRQTLASCVGIESSRGRTGFDHAKPQRPRREAGLRPLPTRRVHLRPRRRDRCGAPTDDSPRREPWVAFPDRIKARTGRQMPPHFPL